MAFICTIGPDTPGNNTKITVKTRENDPPTTPFQVPYLLYRRPGEITEGKESVAVLVTLLMFNCAWTSSSICTVWTVLGNEWHTGSGSYEIIAAKRERDQGKKRKKKGKHCNRLSLPRILFKKQYHLRRCSNKKKLKKNTFATCLHT